ncbi:precorrin-2 C(20)-methyltransferase [Geobacter pelophilus]|uniref:Precorrin-2 C(20)-methyltransferase n=1 Tax=Geoanaerobacter pelophilus TaxID=60036 RepID=A0AAW4L273_9BACT|nr:precorrin-2 C(20)-methyltransferase [Geoanaerobacter pelophilus]MBT0663900.1 precorrin-2 C(20)-methyltransferase [Geoanaerobacter pelophilus]
MNEINKVGTIYAVGVGPGDPELITRKAERLIREADVICTPTGRDDAASYALSIVEPLLDRSRQQVLTQVFPMRKVQDGLDEFWTRSAAEVAEHVRAGRTVVFITIGDPLLYSTFLYLYRVLRADYPDIPVEIVPGISSINAAAAAAGVPLGMAGDRIAVLPAVYEDEELQRTLQEFDTIVLLKVHKVFDRVYAMLCRNGMEKGAVFVRRVGSDQEEVVFDLGSLVGKELDYLSMMIVCKRLQRGDL